MKRVNFILILISCFLFSCQYFEKPPEEEVLARVNEHYLYYSDIKNLISENTSPEDSTVLVNHYINRWATRLLLIDRALVNLNPEELDRYEKLVEEYRNDLLTEAYTNVVVGKQLDSLVSEQEYRDYYEENKENYRLNDALIKVRYIQLSSGYNGITRIREQLERFNEKDQIALSENSYSYLSSNLNDSVWVRKDHLQKILPVLKNQSQVLKKSNFVQLEDSLGVYLIKTEDALGINEVAPISYIKPTLKQVILNKRKLKLINKFESDIARDAIENNNFQIYTHE